MGCLPGCGPGPAHAGPVPPVVAGRQVAGARLILGKMFRAANRPTLRFAIRRECLEVVEVEERRGVIAVADVRDAAAAELALGAFVEAPRVDEDPEVGGVTAVRARRLPRRG